ncbi:MAG: aldehyde dehydrogenase (NADP(+)) [Saprospiraceae bacterium]
MITKNIIGYNLSGLSDKEVFACDPAQKKNLPEQFKTATSDEINLALQKAHSAWRIFRIMEPERRAEFLNAIADGIEALDDILVNRMMLETAYPQARVLVERRRTCAQLRMFAEILTEGKWLDVVIDRAIPGRVPAPRPDVRKMNMAIGPVIVFAASNFPLAYSTAGGDTTSAFAAGCPVIIKAHESHLGTNALVAEVIMNAAKNTGMPDGVFSSLNGDGIETGKALASHPLTAAVGFTGSLQGGRALFDLGQQRKNPIPVFAEMGSVNPVFILPGKLKADHTALVRALVDSMTMTVGQFCTNPGILVAFKNDDTNHLISKLSDSLSAIPATTMLNENISRNYHKGVSNVRIESGVTIVSEHSGTEPHMASPVLATVDADTFLQRPELHHEVFGPFSLVVLCNDFSQMKEIALALEGQLTSTIHLTEEENEQGRELLSILVEKAGRIIFNGVPTGVEVAAAMTHGGPYPASTDSRFTAVGHDAIRRWVRPVTYQDCPEELLPVQLKT